MKTANKGTISRYNISNTTRAHLLSQITVLEGEGACHSTSGSRIVKTIPWCDELDLRRRLVLQPKVFSCLLLLLASSTIWWLSKVKQDVQLPFQRLENQFSKSNILAYELQFNQTQYSSSPLTLEEKRQYATNDFQARRHSSRCCLHNAPYAHILPKLIHNCCCSIQMKTKNFYARNQVYYSGQTE